MAEDKWKAEAECRVEVAAGKQKAGEPAKKRAREEPVASSSSIQVIDLQWEYLFYFLCAYADFVKAVCAVPSLGCSA